MYMKDVFRFLIRTAIPEVTNQKHIPDDEDLAECFPVVGQTRYGGIIRKSNLVWDAIWKAHRDVVSKYTSRAWEFYRGFERDGSIKHERNVGYCNEGINGMARELFARVMKSESPLRSRDLILELSETFPEPESFSSHYMANRDYFNTTTFGAIQLLVNLTLKNLLILKAFGCVGLERIEIDEEGCDCPLDRVTRKAMGGDPDDWMCLTPEDYQETQWAIRNDLFLDSGVTYDFWVRHRGKLFADD